MHALYDNVIFTYTSVFCVILGEMGYYISSHVLFAFSSSCMHDSSTNMNNIAAFGV